MQRVFYSCLFAITIAFFSTACSKSGGSGEEQPGKTEQTGVKYVQIDQDGNAVNEIVSPAKITMHELIMVSSDLSCASASLATILKYSFNEDVTEETVIQGLFEYGDIEMITQRKAFSLLDMKRYLEAIGYTGTGYTIAEGISLSQLQSDDFDSLAQLTITPIETPGSKRFVAFRGYDENYIYLGDPSRGNICMSIPDFAGVISNNIIFVLGRKDSSQEVSCIFYKTVPSLQGIKILDDISLADIF
jgi:predicted double-glycine peptidase